MTKRPYYKTAERVLTIFDLSQTINSVKLGEKLGLHPAYVRKVLQRNGRKLPTARKRNTQET